MAVVGENQMAVDTKAESRALGQLGELWEHDERRVHTGAEQPKPK